MCYISRDELLEELEKLGETLEENEKQSEKFKSGQLSGIDKVKKLAKTLKLQREEEERIPVSSIAGVQIKDLRRDKEDREIFYSGVYEKETKDAKRLNMVRSLLRDRPDLYYLTLKTRKGYQLNLLLQKEEDSDESEE